MPTAFTDLVVLIPGILGSRLVRRQGNKVVTVWDLSLRHLPRLLREAMTGGLVLEGNGVAPPDDGIEAADLFDYQLLPGFFGVDDYQGLVSSLRSAVGDRQLITFPYDWRLSNRRAAARLEVVALDRLRSWRSESGARNAKLWLIGHSMGGLVARHFCEHLGGSKDTRAIITIGTPHRGSVRALDALANGKHFGPINLTKLVRSLPSVYELLPLFPVIREGDGIGNDLRRISEMFGLDPVTGADVEKAVSAGHTPTPIPGLDRTMLQRALQFHADIRVPAERRNSSGEPSPYRQEAFFNRRQHTPASARLQGDRIKVLETYLRRHDSGWLESNEYGDGTVPAFSSVPIEWDDTANGIANGQKHAAMQSTVEVIDSLTNWFRPLDTRTTKGAPVSDDNVVQLDVPATLMSGEELVVIAAVGRPMNASIEIADVSVDSPAPPGRPVILSPEARSIELGRPRPGVYRITARPTDPTIPVVSDYSYIIDPSGN